MTEEIIVNLFRKIGLGAVLPPIVPVAGGFLHRMYRVRTEHRSYAVKHLNPEILQRPAAMENFRRAEALEAVLEQAGIPIVAAIAMDGHKMQTLDGAYFYIFPWQNGTTTDWYHTSVEQCRMDSPYPTIHALSELL